MFSRFLFDRLQAAVALSLSVTLMTACTTVRTETEADIEVFDPESSVVEAPAEALTLYERAVEVFAAGQTADAELRFQEFLLQYPDYPGAYLNLAIIFANRDDLDEAEGALRKVLSIEPANAAALNQLGMLMRRRGDFVAAEAAYLKAIDHSPDYALAYFNLGVLNDLYLRRLDSAVTHYQHYESLVGEDQQVSRWIADLKRRIAATERAARLTK